MAIQQSGAGAIGRPRATRPWKPVLDFASRKPLGAAGALIIVVMALMAVIGPVITEWDPLAHNLPDKLQGPNGRHWLGTDELGRDLWSRMMTGARVSLLVGFVSVGFGSGAGGIIGVVSGWYGGKVDNVIQRIMDSLMSIPTLILALAVTAALGTSLWNIILAIGIVQIPRANRVVRSQVFAVKESQYVDAARAIGAVNVRIMVQHIAPTVCRALADNRHRRARNRHSDRGVIEFPWSWRSSAGTFLGWYAHRSGTRLVSHIPILGHMAWPGFVAGGVRLQPLRRRHPRRPGSQAARDVGRRTPDQVNSKGGL